MLRELDLPAAERERLCAELSAHVRVVSARAPLGAACGLHLHATQSGLVARGLPLHGRSCHDPEDVWRAAASGADYVTLSPVAPSRSKPGYGPPLAPLPPVPVPTPAELAPEWDAFLADLPNATQHDIEILTREGAPVPTLLETASERHVDLIVMGTLGRTGIAHLLIGSVAEGVVREAPCPVLTLRPEAVPFELP